MILVTGANGFIGSALIWELNRRGLKDILAVDSVSPRLRPELLQPLRYAEFVEAEELLADLSALGDKITFVFHMGACSSTTETDKNFLKRNNLEYSQTLFKFCSENEIPLVYASSAAVYGLGEKGFGEDLGELNPLNLYGWSKAEFDRWVLKQQKTPPRWFGLRFFNVYGPNEYHKGDMASVALKAFQQIRKTGELRLFRSENPNYEDGKQMRDFVYIKDVTSWMWDFYIRTDFTETRASGIYNIGYGSPRTWLDLAHSVFEGMGMPAKIQWIDMPENVRAQYQYYTCAGLSKLRAQGLPAPKWTLEAGIQDYLKNYLLKGQSVLTP